MLYNLSARVTIKRWTTIKNEFGGLVPMEVASWEKWADVKISNWQSADYTIASGVLNKEYQQDKWQYDTNIILRYEKERPTKSNDTIIYEGNTYTIDSISINTESAKSFEIIKCSKIDQNINDDAPMDTDNIKVANYTSEVGGEYIIVLPELIAKNVFGAFKDGIQFVVKTTGTANGKEVKFNSSTGELTWGQLFEAGEVATILYY